MIIIVFPKYVGGKFIANSLALSRHCLIQDRKFADLDLSMNVDEKYYKFKLDSVLKSIPPSGKMRNWGKFEFGCKQLYGIDEDFYHENSINEIKTYIEESDIFTDIKTSGRESVIVTHDYQTFLKYLMVFPEAKIVEFENFDNFRKFSTLLKDPRPACVNDPEFLDGKTYYHNMKNYYRFDSFKVNVDDTYTNWELFNTMMEQLYKFVGFDDYNSDLVRKYWEAYIFQPEILSFLWNTYKETNKEPVIEPPQEPNVT